MNRKRKAQRWGMPDDRREPIGARLSLLLILVNAFLWIGLRNVDIVIVSLASLLIAIAGMTLGYRSGKRIQRNQGRIAGESLARIGYWGNLLLFVGAFFLFAFSVGVGILRGDFL